MAMIDVFKEEMIPIEKLADIGFMCAWEGCDARVLRLVRHTLTIAGASA
jgi:hypothetical protein